MEIDDLYHHALSILPEAAADIAKTGRDRADFVFASFDGSSPLGIAFIATDLATELGVEPLCARAEVERMIASAQLRGEELVVSLMVGKDVLGLLLTASEVDDATRGVVRAWLDAPLAYGNYRVVAIAGAEVRAASVECEGGDGEAIEDRPPVSASMLN